MCVKYSAEWWQRVASIPCEYVQNDPKQGQAALANDDKENDRRKEARLKPADV
jgi:hypothetical protein